MVARKTVVSSGTQCCSAKAKATSDKLYVKGSRLAVERK
jgi:hypothetical protein